MDINSRPLLCAVLGVKVCGNGTHSTSCPRQKTALARGWVGKARKEAPSYSFDEIFLFAHKP